MSLYLYPRPVPVPDRWPKRMRDLVRAIQAAGWPVLVGYSEDSGGCPFLTIDARELTDGRDDGDERRLMVTWHTRATGGKSYRLFSCMLFVPWHGGRDRHGWRDMSVTALISAVGDEPGPDWNQSGATP